MCSSNTSHQKHHPDPRHRSSALLMLGLQPLIHCATAICTAAHDSPTITATSVLQLPLKMLHHAAHSTATANYCTATQLLRVKQLKDITQNPDRQVSLAASPSVASLCRPSRALHCCCSALCKHCLCVAEIPPTFALMLLRCCYLCSALLQSLAS